MTRSVHYASSRDAGFENLPIFPTGYLAFRLLQVALAVSLLVICAWAMIFMVTWSHIYMLVYVSTSMKENHHVDSESQNAQATTNAPYRPVNQSQNSLPYPNHPQQQTANQQQQTAEQQQQAAEQQQQTAEQQQQTARPLMPDTH
ncbi:hypothetical protein Brms1b_001840 [Colletotrichum noveboracense]|nr:hypothetical protein Brms1b_001840 [Colletotrichum noveboracense]